MARADASEPQSGPGPGPAWWRATGGGVAVVLVVAVAAGLYFGLGLPWQQAAGLPLLSVGALLVARSTHGALCFAAFSITPFGVVQQEVLGVTLNLPEVLIVALAAKEGGRLFLRRGGLPAALPGRTLLVFLLAAATALATGFFHGNGAIRILQDCRQFVEYLVLFWLVLQCVSGRDEAIRITFSYVLGASLVAVHGIAQQVVPVGITESQISSDFVLHQGIRSGSFYGATPLGGLMVLAIAPAIGVVLSSRRRAIQGLMGICIVLCLVAIVFTRTRGSWLGLAVALGLIAVSLRPSGKTLATAVGAGMVLAILLGPVVLQRLYTLADPVQDISLMARAQYYAAASHIGRAHPVLGLGWGCFYDIDTILNAEKYVPATMAEVAEREEAEAAAFQARRAAQGKADEDLPLAPVEVEEATVHSAYLQLFVKTGLLGLVAFLAIITVWVERVWRGRNTRFQEDPGHALFVGIAAGIAGYLFHSTFENFFQWPVMAQSFWLLFGLTFLLAPRLEGEAPRYGVPLAFMGSAAAIFLLFMFACLRLETLHPGHYERNVAKALEADDPDKAIRIAQRATEVDPYAPMPYTVLARLLLDQGDRDGAMAAFEKAFGTEQRPGGPPIRFTGEQYYFAPARLSLGQYHAHRGDWDSARKQFRLASAYADLTDDAYVDFHPLLFQAYSDIGHWERALKFGEPPGVQTAGLAERGLLHLAHVCTHAGRWSLLSKVVDSLRVRNGLDAEADYYEGRALLGQGDLVGAAASLKRAAEAGRSHGSYFQGRALAEAGWSQAALPPLLATPQEDHYRMVALAEAWMHITGAGGDASAVWKELMAAIQGMDAVPAATEEEGLRLLAYQFPKNAPVGGAQFPALLLWGHAAGDLTTATGLTIDHREDGCVVELTGSGLMLELRTVENLVDWAAVERGGARGRVPGGWIDSPGDWFDLTAAPTASVVTEGPEDVSIALKGQTWIYTVPARVADGAGCFALGRFRDPDGTGRFSLQHLNIASRVIGGATLSAWEPLPAWSTRRAYVGPQEARVAVRLAFETNSTSARVVLDDLVLLALEAPEPTP